jgi:hypothetical protein
MSRFLSTIFYQLLRIQYSKSDERDRQTTLAIKQTGRSAAFSPFHSREMTPAFSPFASLLTFDSKCVNSNSTRRRCRLRIITYGAWQ